MFGKNPTIVSALKLTYEAKTGKVRLKRNGRFVKKEILSEITGGKTTADRNKKNRIVMTNTRNAANTLGTFFVSRSLTAGFKALIKINARKRP
jgi:hypothetical protein